MENFTKLTENAFLSNKATDSWSERTVPDSSLRPGTGFPVEGFREFSQPLQANSGIVTQNEPRIFPSHLLSIHCISQLTLLLMNVVKQLNKTSGDWLANPGGRAG
jgi:hypothetical protein